MGRSILGVIAAALMLLPALAVADDWTADKLRGSVLQFVDGQWQPLSRGSVVPDTRVIRTTAAGHVTFTRGGETVDLGPNTQIQIYDKAGKKPFTTVKQYFGTVSVEAEVQNVQHFAVDTPFLAAVVKGTRFTVVSSKTGSSVTVRRGHVAVENLKTHSHVLLSVGQTATIDGDKTSGEIGVSGSGKLPAVQDAHGNELVSLNAPGGLISATVGDDGVTVGVTELARLNVGGGNSLVSLNLGGNGNSGSNGNSHSSGNSGSGNSGSGGSGNSGSGGGGGNSGHGGGHLLNLNIGGIHIGL